MRRHLSSSELKLKMISVRELWADSESELRWADLAEQYWPHLSGTVLYQVWRRMKRKLPNYESLSFQGAFQWCDGGLC